MQSSLKKIVHLFKVDIENKISPQILCRSIDGCDNPVLYGCLGCSCAFWIDNQPEKISADKIKTNELKCK